MYWSTTLTALQGGVVQWIQWSHYGNRCLEEKFCVLGGSTMSLGGNTVRNTMSERRRVATFDDMSYLLMRDTKKTPSEYNHLPYLKVICAPIPRWRSCLWTSLEAAGSTSVWAGARREEPGRPTRGESWGARATRWPPDITSDPEECSYWGRSRWVHGWGRERLNEVLTD